MKKLLLVVAAITSLALTSCGERTEPYYERMYRTNNWDYNVLEDIREYQMTYFGTIYFYETYIMFRTYVVDFDYDTGKSLHNPHYYGDVVIPIVKYHDNRIVEIKFYKGDEEYIKYGYFEDNAETFKTTFYQKQRVYSLIGD